MASALDQPAGHCGQKPRYQNLDSGGINKAVERENHPQPFIDYLNVELNGVRVFFKLDLNCVYNRLEPDDASRDIDTFKVHDTPYRYKRLCFGINSASEIFQEFISDMISGIKGARNLQMISSPLNERSYTAVSPVAI